MNQEPQKPGCCPTCGQKIKPKKEPKPPREPDPEDLRFARWMFERVLKVAPLTKEPNWNSWAEHVRKLREVDGIPLGVAAELFAWVHRDPFWSLNIRSPEKLREKFAELDAKRRATYANPRQDPRQPAAVRESTVTRASRAAAERAAAIERELAQAGSSPGEILGEDG
jgi:hypothetical protein